MITRRHGQGGAVRRRGLFLALAVVMAPVTAALPASPSNASSGPSQPHARSLGRPFTTLADPPRPGPIREAVRLAVADVLR